MLLILLTYFITDAVENGWKVKISVITINKIASNYKANLFKSAGERGKARKGRLLV